MFAVGLGGGAWCASRFGLFWGAAWALAVAALLPLVLAVEFALLELANHRDPAPRASVLELCSAWCAESLTAWRVFGWQQAWRVHAEPDHLPAPSHAQPQAQCGRVGVVLVHGYCCNRGLWNRWMPRLRALGVPFIAVTMEPPFGAIERGVPAIEGAVAALLQATGRAPVLVGHSMGGLAIRAWLKTQRQAPANVRWQRAITLGSPHHGTWLARFAHTRNGRQMRQANPWLSALAAEEDAGLTAQFICFYSHADNIVFPASTATLPGADNRHLRAQGHVQMIDHPSAWAALCEELGLVRP